jgi:hypothetical protein
MFAFKVKLKRFIIGCIGGLVREKSEMVLLSKEDFNCRSHPNQSHYNGTIFAQVYAPLLHLILGS